jgi:hypothetical protein
MSKFLNKRHKYQSTREVDRRQSKALAEAEAKHELLGIESLRESNPRMREYFMRGDFYDPRRGYFFVNEPGIAAARRQPPGGHDDWFGGEPVEIPAYAMDQITRRPGILRKQFVTTGFEEEFVGRRVVSVIDSFSPGLAETMGWGGPRSLNISSIESMGTHTPKGVKVHVVGDGEFTDEEPVCPHCGRRHRSFGMGSLFGSLLSEYIDMLSNARRKRRDTIDGEFHHVHEQNLLTHDPKDPE